MGCTGSFFFGRVFLTFGHFLLFNCSGFLAYSVVPSTFSPLSFTHQHVLPDSIHCIESNSSFILHFGINSSSRLLLGTFHTRSCAFLRASLHVGSFSFSTSTA